MNGYEWYQWYEWLPMVVFYLLLNNTYRQILIERLTARNDRLRLQRAAIARYRCGGPIFYNRKVVESRREFRTD